MLLAKKAETYTYTDYLAWPNDERYELIYGIPYNLAAPTRVHQEISGRLYTKIANYLEGKKCKVYYAPFDVRLFGKPAKALKKSPQQIENDKITTVVQPDISVFCDLTKLDDAGAIGAPDFVIEILSPSTREKDMSTKLLLYQKAEVKEYWIVDIDNQTIQVFLLQDDLRYHPGEKKYDCNDIIKVDTLESLEINLADIFY